MIYLATLGFALLLTLALTPLAGSLGRRWGLVDAPGGRRKHQGVIPRTGGLALFGGFFVTVLLIAFLPDWLPASTAWFPARNDPKRGAPAGRAAHRLDLLRRSSACSTTASTSKSGPQYLIQFGAAVIGFAGLIFIKHVNNPFGDGFLFGPDGFPWWIVFPLTVFWFMGMMNTINFLDGASGLVAGVTAVLSRGAGAAHDLQGRTAAAERGAAAASRCWVRRWAFCPSTLPGASSWAAAAATSSALSSRRWASSAARGIAAVMMVVGLPALEVGWLMLTRWRRGLSPGQGGRDHLHFRLLDMGVDERALVVGYWLFCAALGAFTLLIDDRLLKLVALLLVAALGISVFVWARRQVPVTSLPSD